MKKIPIIYIFPNIITLTSACCAITAARYAIEGRFSLSVSLILFSALLDALDGRMARLLNASSDFGAEWDSLSDFAAFGVAPAIIMYYWGLHQAESLGWASSLFFMCCCGLRLARFNIAQDTQDELEKKFFHGVPAPAGAIMGLLPIILHINGFFTAYEFPLFLCAWFVAIGVLMISSIPTFSFKNITIKPHYRRWILVVFALLLALIFHHFWLMAVIISIVYLLSLPFSSWVYYKKCQKRDKTHA